MSLVKPMAPNGVAQNGHIDRKPRGPNGTDTKDQYLQRIKQIQKEIPAH